MAELRVPARFRGPPGVANGGVASGSLAALLGGAAEVTLRRPVPLDRPLPVRGDRDGTLVVEGGGVLLAEARPATAAAELLAVPGNAAVTPEAAEAAAGRSRYYDHPIFPGCFVCGPARTPGDGLRIFPGRVAGGDAADRPAATAVVLGRMAATVGGLPRPGDRCRVVAWPLTGRGRKLGAGSALLGPDGEVLAAARTVWITVARHTVGGGGAASTAGGAGWR